MQIVRFKMKKISHWLYDFLIKKEFSETMATYLNVIVLCILLVAVLLVIDMLSRKILRKVSSGIATASKTKLDDLLIENRVPRRVGHLIPFMIAYWTVPHIFQDFPQTQKAAIIFLKLLAIVLVLRIARAFLNSLKSYFKTKPRLKDKPIDSYIQVFMIFAWFAGVFLALAVVADIDLWKFLAGLGTISAVIILVFRDTILGFVASIQVATNDIVRIGDWITFDKYGADGDVIEINLATVKVQNFDKTITTIPTYALISDSFKNWRGMNDSDGRRIKRAIYIKQESIKFLTSDAIEQLKKIELITTYLSDRQEKIDASNTSLGISRELQVNGRNLTNIGVFRKYMETYISQHSAVNKDMMIMARQLAPTSQGVPLEIYCFSSDKRWQNYEYIMADIFDHFLASVSYFDLELFELPSTGVYVPKN
ncbi:miniconductance mechanosensitive channel [Dokdonia pacifica]|uniref:Mechanosensing system component YbdG n=2 Tax=Dokdonia pacifica TaxID=1627892 RepID=A0A239DAR3_9FLAO|nr:miniconductance mechanosensitive channel [Dokdonia pacifica]